LKVLVLALCCAADVFVLRIIWSRTDIAGGQFRRGYFEELAGEVGLAMDSAVRPDTLPRFLLTEDGDLGIPPGMTAVMPLVQRQSYELSSDAMRAPYVLIGSEGPVATGAGDRRIPSGEARLLGARTLSLQDGRLAFVEWNATRPWRDDAARLTAVDQMCGSDGGPLTINVVEGGLHVGFGRCSLVEPLPSASASLPLLAVPAGPEWATIARLPNWKVESAILWPVFAVVILKEVGMWMGLGLASAAAVAAVLACASLFAPVEAALAWAPTLIIAVAAAVFRILAMALWILPRWVRVPAVLALVALVAWAVANGTPHYPQKIMRTRQGGSQSDSCVVVGYSTVKGEALRGDRGGIRWLLDETCPRCRGKTAALFASGETLAWLRDAFCASAPSFGGEGQVTFLGGTNDDFLWALSSPMGALAMARAFIQPGLGPWQHGYEAAAAASLARIDEQVSALEGLMRCAHSRRAQFLFLHDFTPSDMIAGRLPDRTAMLARRRATVESMGNTFVDLLERFGTDAGIAWFNDSVHLSLIGHRRVAELVCGESP